MFLNKEFKKINREISNSKSIHDNNDEVVINIKADNEEQIFSSYNYDNKTSLNSELSNYLWENAKLAPPYKKLKLQVYCNKHIDKNEVNSAIKSHYRREYIEVKDEIKKTRLFSTVCLFLGIISLLILLAINKLSNTYLTSSVMDIVAWVFVWESVDGFFFKGGGLSHRCRILMRLYSAEIVIITNEINNNISNNILIGDIDED